jgi:hypothetical protein
LTIVFPVDADLFMDIEDAEWSGPADMPFLWGVLHLGTLGLFPMFFDNDIIIRLTLYDSKGNVLRKEEIKNPSTTWAWSPLIFFNGFKFFGGIDLREPLRERAFDHLLVRVRDEHPVRSGP